MNTKKSYDENMINRIKTMTSQNKLSVTPQKELLSAYAELWYKLEASNSIKPLLPDTTSNPGKGVTINGQPDSRKFFLKLLAQARDQEFTGYLNIDKYYNHTREWILVANIKYIRDAPDDYEGVVCQKLQTGMSFSESEAIANGTHTKSGDYPMAKRLPTTKELRDFMANHPNRPAVYRNEDQWAAVRSTKGQRDYI